MIFNEARAKSSILHVFPFNSEKKRGGVAVHVVIDLLEFPPLFITTTTTKPLIPNKLGKARNEKKSEIIKIKDPDPNR
jgi:hypothetical protein